MRNYFIINKEPNSIQCIKNVLEDYNEFNCIGVSSEYNHALNFILKETPNLVFFDLDNTFEKPFELIKELNLLFNDYFPVFIAISSSKEKAYEAIKNGFFDFILNPLSELEIRKSVLKFQKKSPAIINKNIC